MCRSTIDWCEKNYVVSQYIAEYWNTLSGIAIGISALYWRVTSNIWVYKGLYTTNVIRKSFVSVFWYLIIVSLGTMLFHGTLLYKYQLMDELPMLMISMSYVRIMSRLYTSRVLFGQRTVYNLELMSRFGVIVIFIVPIAYLIDPILHNVLFHFTLKVFEGTLLLMLYKLSKNTNKIVYDSLYDSKYNQLVVSRDENTYENTCENTREILLSQVQQDIKLYIELYKGLKVCTKKGVRLYSLSLTLWVLENLFCSKVEFLQFHACWHVLSSMGIYYLNKMIESHVKIHLLLTEKVKTE
jgi:hypothetical protein